VVRELSTAPPSSLALEIDNSSARQPPRLELARQLSDDVEPPSGRGLRQCIGEGGLDCRNRIRTSSFVVGRRRLLDVLDRIHRSFLGLAHIR
jgi:hypothetical protein